VSGGASSKDEEDEEQVEMLGAFVLVTQGVWNA
jgi:hypothetical protein